MLHQLTTHRRHVSATMTRATAWALCWAVVVAAVTRGTRAQQQQPNIVLMLADDLGWADLENHDPEMRTPNLQYLAARGMLLNQSYVLPTCAPTRSALLTGRYVTFVNCSPDSTSQLLTAHWTACHIC